MSGTGGGGSGVFGDEVVEFDCARLAFETALANPSDEALDIVTVGEVLPLLLIDSPYTAIVAVLSSGVIAGAIAESVARLLHCMADGYQYDAEVTGVDGAAIRVRVRPSQEGCDALMFDTDLGSESGEQRNSIKIDDVLKLQLATIIPYSVEVVMESGSIVGIIQERLGWLARCLLAGSQYLAVVTSVSEETVNVRVQTI